jgi:hypothetical protein
VIDVRTRRRCAPCVSISLRTKLVCVVDFKVSVENEKQNTRNDQKAKKYEKEASEPRFFGME